MAAASSFVLYDPPYLYLPDGMPYQHSLGSLVLVLLLLLIGGLLAFGLSYGHHGRGIFGLKPWNPLS